MGTSMMVGFLDERENGKDLCSKRFKDVGIGFTS